MNIIVIDDNLKPLKRFIEKLKLNHIVKLFDGLPSLKHYETKIDFELAFIDLDLSGTTNSTKRNTDGYKVAEYLKNTSKNIVCILLTGESPDIDDVFKNEYIDDYLDKQHRSNFIIVDTIIKRWERHLKLAQENYLLKETVREYEITYNENQLIAEQKGLFTQSLEINAIIDKLKNFCNRGFIGDILLMGESGTGKELFAEIIHEFSDRKNKPLKIVNMSDFKNVDFNMAHSEVFGHIKGSFTGATNDREGAISIAENGIIFFDEIHNSGLDFQNKLLRFVDKKEYSQLGSDENKKADVKVIASFNEDIQKLYKENRLKQDLIERFLFPIKIPNLKDRGRNEFEYVVKKIITKENPNITISKEAINILWNQNYKDSNLRKLSNILGLTINLMNGNAIDVGNLELRPENETTYSNKNKTNITENLKKRIKLILDIEKSVSQLNEGKKVNVSDVEHYTKLKNLSNKFSTRNNPKQASELKFVIENGYVECPNCRKYFSPIINLLEKK